VMFTIHIITFVFIVAGVMGRIIESLIEY